MNGEATDAQLRLGPLERLLMRECVSMTEHALGLGLRIPAAVAESVNVVSGVLKAEGDSVAVSESTKSAPRARIEVGQLARIHAHLAQTIAPAKPRTILLLADEAQRGSLFFFLGPVPLVRRLMLIAALSLLVLFGVSLSGMVDGRPESFSLLSNSSMSLLLNELFLLSAAAIGACFSGLFQANRYISAGTFDPRQESSYWIRFALGLMAGVILATLVPIESFTEVKSGSGVQGSLGGLGAPALALLGGFSAAVVHRILYRLVSAIESVVKGDPHANLDNKLASVKG